MEGSWQCLVGWMDGWMEFRGGWIDGCMHTFMDAQS